MKVPTKSQLSYLRLYVDVAWMLWNRCRNASPRCGWSRYLFWDSSPQFGRDYEMALVRSIKKSHLRRLLRALHGMKTMWTTLLELPADHHYTNHDREIMMLKEKERVIMQECRASMEFQSLPAVTIGFGCSGFPRKVRALMHAMRLSHFTKSSLIDYIQEICTSTHDYGTEKLISRLKPVRLEAINPHFDDTQPALVTRSLQSGRRDEAAAPVEVADDGRNEAAAPVEAADEFAAPQLDADVFEDPILDDDDDDSVFDEPIVDDEVFEHPALDAREIDAEVRFKLWFGSGLRAPAIQDGA